MRWKLASYNSANLAGSFCAAWTRRRSFASERSPRLADLPTAILAFLMNKRRAGKKVTVIGGPKQPLPEARNTGLTLGHVGWLQVASCAMLRLYIGWVSCGPQPE